jgi:VanZ family protein
MLSAPMELTPLSAPRTPRNVTFAWLAVAACIALIWGLSADLFAASETSRFLKPFLLWLFPDLDPATLRRAHFLVRKSAHVTEYAVLALLAFRAWWLSFETTLVRIAALSLALVFAVAAIDEARQSLSAARTGTPWDVALDLAGGAAALVLLIAAQRGLRPASAPSYPRTPG